jgi:hypothetical protein
MKIEQYVLVLLSLNKNKETDEKNIFNITFVVFIASYFLR